jgi:uncharacterized protein (TIGR02118 family)
MAKRAIRVSAFNRPGDRMPGIKLVMIFPSPIDVEAFEKAYAAQQLPLLASRLGGETKVKLTKVLGAPDGHPVFNQIAEIYFPSLEALEARLASPEAQELAANAISISTGGTPVFLFCEELSLPVVETE